MSIVLLLAAGACFVGALFQADDDWSLCIVGWLLLFGWVAQAVTA